MEPLALEDNFTDILGKARRGLGLTEEALAAGAGVSLSSYRELAGGMLREDTLAAVAPLLHLHPGALLEIARGWQPSPVTVEGLVTCTTDCGDMLVNNFVIFDPASRDALVIDTGADAMPARDVLCDLGLTLRRILITHGHRDHIQSLAAWRQAFPEVPVFAGREAEIAGALPVDDGWTCQMGSLTIDARETSGHARCGMTYVISGLSRPVAVVGDAIFAGSMGGGMISWSQALDHNRRRLFSLPDNTVLCPGHGPLTTVAEEKAHNPFYPEFKPNY